MFMLGYYWKQFFQLKSQITTEAIYPFSTPSTQIQNTHSSTPRICPYGVTHTVDAPHYLKTQKSSIKFCITYSRYFIRDIYVYTFYMFLAIVVYCYYLRAFYILFYESLLCVLYINGFRIGDYFLGTYYDIHYITLYFSLYFISDLDCFKFNMNILVISSIIDLYHSFCQPDINLAIPGKRNLICENSSIRLDCRHICVAFDC